MPQAIAKVVDLNLDQLLSAKTKALKLKLDNQKRRTEQVEEEIEEKLITIIG